MCWCWTRCSSLLRCGVHAAAASSRAPDGTGQSAANLRRQQQAALTSTLLPLCVRSLTLLLLQARFPERQYRMVVSMSLGAPGPLTIEQLFFR